MEPIEVGDDLNEVSVLVNVAHRLLLGIRDDIETDPALQAIVDELNAAHDELDRALESLGRAIDQVDSATDQPRGQRPTLH
jgi:ABC-type transporter Mla subunit MlaD